MKSCNRISYFSGLFLAAHLSPTLPHQPADLCDVILDTQLSVKVTLPELVKYVNDDHGADHAPFSLVDESSVSGGPLVSVNVARPIGGNGSYVLALNSVPFLEVHKRAVRISLAEIFTSIRDSLLEDKNRR